MNSATVLIRLCQVIGLVFLLVAVFGLGTAGYFAYEGWQFQQESVPATATVVELDEVELRYYPIFVFEDQEGREHRVRSDFGSFPPRHEEGDAMQVRYLPEDPEGTVRVDAFQARWTGIVLAGLLGVLPLIFGLFLLLVMPRLLRRLREQASNRP